MKYTTWFAETRVYFSWFYFGQLVVYTAKGINNQAKYSKLCASN